MMADDDDVAFVDDSGWMRLMGLMGCVDETSPGRFWT